MFELSLFTLWLFGAICFSLGWIICAAFCAGKTGEIGDHKKS